MSESWEFIDNHPESGYPVHVRLGLALRRGIETTEAALGFFFQTLLGLTIGGLIIVHFTLSPMSAGRTAVFVGMILGWLLFDIRSMWHLWRTMFRGPRPLFIETALRQRPLPLLVRPVGAIWWLTHFGLGLLSAFFMEHVDPNGGPFVQFFTLVVASFYALAANGYLIFAAAALFPNRRFLERVSSVRILIDIGLVALSFLVAPPRMPS